MLMLLLAIACSVVISVIMRLSGRYVRHRMAMFAVNYAACLVLSRLFVGGAPLLGAQRGLGTAAALGRWPPDTMLSSGRIPSRSRRGENPEGGQIPGPPAGRRRNQMVYPLQYHRGL